MKRPPATGPPQVKLTPQSDDGGRYRQASTAVVFHPKQPPMTGDFSWLI